MAQTTTGGRRAKVSVTVDPKLLKAVDDFVEAHPDVDRSKVFDDALHEWYARRQAEAMAAQFAEPVSETERAEYQAWRQIRNAAAERRFGRSGR